MAEQLLERNASSPDLAETGSHNQQFRQPEKTENYDSGTHKQAYHPTQQSFNEQRDEYTEQAYNTYESGNGSSNADSTDHSPAKTPIQPQPLSPSGPKPPSPPALPAGEGGQAAYDSALDRMKQKREKTIAREEKLYHSIDYKKRIRLTTAKRYQKKHPMTEKEAAHRLVSGRKRSVSYATFTLGDRPLLQEAEQEKRLEPKKQNIKSQKDHQKTTTKSNPNPTDNRLLMRETEKRLVTKEPNKQTVKERKQEERLKKGKDSGKQTGQSGRFLLLQTTEKRLTQKQYDRRSKKNYRKKYARDAAIGEAVRKGRLLFDDGSLPDDDDAAAIKNALRKGARTGQLTIRRSTRNIGKQTNKYARLKFASDQEKLLDKKIEQRISQNAYRQEKEAAKALKTKAEQKKKMQQAMQFRRAREGSFIRRTKNHIMLKKKSVEQKAKKTKSIISVAVSVTMILAVVLFSNLFLVAFGMIAFSTASWTYAQTIVPVDYNVMSECTAYYRSLETDLTERLTDTESLENLEEELREEYGDDIHAFVYELADISFDSPVLVAYLGAKYAEFSLADVQEELEELFALNYVLHTETRMEYREDAEEEVKVCYITLEKTPLEEIVAERLSEEQLAQYEIYRLSTGGQQVYGPVMREDWTNLISSNYGERIHPITEERTFHKGIDIAIPLGTPLYSAVDGTVTEAGNSSTAGNYVRIQNSSGWTVTFMHMDSFTVAAGDVVRQGDFVGYSGNTGRSTGPHLHLEVWDQDRNPVNPIFIVPQNCAYIETEED